MREFKHRITRLRPYAQLFALYMLMVIVYTWLGGRKAQPSIFADELIYGNIAQSFAHGNGFTWRGTSTGLTTLLYPLTIAPAWLVENGVTAYQLVKLINASVMCLAAVPIWLLARCFLPARHALLAAGLTIGGAWMESIGKAMTENIAFPLATAAICATVMACRADDDGEDRAAESADDRRSTQFWIWIALGFGVLAAFTRLQLTIIPVVTVMALSIDIFRHPPASRPNLWRKRRLPIVVTAGAITAAVTAVLIDQSVLGRFAAVRKFHPSPDQWMTWTFYQTEGLVVVSGIVPFITALAVMLSRSSWRDRDLGPLLAVTAPLVVFTSAMSGWFASGNTAGVWLLERYVIYSIPLLLLIFVAAAGKVERKFAYAAVVIVSASIIATPKIGVESEAKSFLSLIDRLDGLGGALNISAGVLRAVVTFAISSVAIYWIARRKLWPAALVVALVLGSATLWTWTFESASAKHAAASHYSPSAWVDQAADGPVSMLFAGRSDSILPVWLEFFNTSIDSAYSLPGATVPADGLVCSLSVASNGSLVLQSDCPEPPSRQLVIVGDGRATLTVREGRLIADHGIEGRLVSTPTNPRLLATVGTVPCDPAAPTGCSGQVIVNAWLDRDAVLTVHLRGAAQSQKLEVGQRTYRLDPGKITVVRIPMAGGFQSITLPTDWSQPAANSPALTRATVDEGSGPVEIFTD